MASKGIYVRNTIFIIPFFTIIKTEENYAKKPGEQNY